MADSTVTQGDTWPPQRFRLVDHKGELVNFSTADEATALIRGKKDTILISGPVQAIEPPEEDDDGEIWNGRYLWQEGDTDEPAEDYDVEINVVWDAASSPPKRQTFPTKNPRPTLEIVKSNAS